MAEDPGKKGVIKLIIERTRSERVKKDYRKHIQEKIKSSEIQRMRQKMMQKPGLKKNEKARQQKRTDGQQNPFKIT